MVDLRFVGAAGKFHVANLRTVLRRNALIALAVVVAAVAVLAVGVREGYRSTLTIAAFDVPVSLEARGITGQVVVKAFFDELIRRRAIHRVDSANSVTVCAVFFAGQR